MSDATERPSIEFEGRRYDRRQGVWYEAINHMRAPAHISQRIDTAAKRDLPFWQLCQRQDFADDPKNKGKLLFDVSDLDLESLFDSEPLDPQSSSASKSKRRLRSGENVKISFRNVSQELIVHCNIEPGWRETGSGWLFQESDRVELSSSHRLRVSVKMIEHTFGQLRRRLTSEAAPARFAVGPGDSIDQTYPIFPQAEYALGLGIRLFVDNGGSTFVVDWLDRAGDLNGALPWKRVDREWVFKAFCNELYEEPIRQGDRPSCVARPFYVEIEAVLKELSERDQAPEYAERTPFASGGLPSLGKRR